jgi:RNA polymerase sigma-70 factor (ECF subfamily)
MRGVVRVVPSSSDLELLDAWQAGDHVAGEELFDRHFDPVMRFFRNKLDQGCEDLVQQTFLACLEARDRFRRESSFRTFLFAVAHNVLRNHLRSKRRRGPEIDFSRESVWGIAPSPSTILTRHRNQERLLDALRRIPVEHQVALELHYWEDLTAAEIAAVLTIPTGTAKTRLRRAKALLVEQLQDEAGDDLDARARGLKGVVLDG